MAFQGINFTFGFILAPGSSANGPGQPISPAPIYGPSSASQNFTGGVGTTTNGAPTPAKGQFAMVSVYAAADSWVTIGPTPADPNGDMPSGGRRFIPATTAIDIFCNAGDKARGVQA